MKDEEGAGERESGRAGEREILRKASTLVKYPSISFNRISDTTIQRVSDFVSRSPAPSSPALPLPLHPSPFI
jgi:hypothetical protein